MSIAQTRPLSRSVAVAAALLMTCGTTAASAQSLSFGSLAPSQGGQHLHISDMNPAVEPSNITPEMRRLVEDIHTHTNIARQNAGARPVRESAKMRVIAQNWSEQMAAEDRMYHNPEIRNLVNDAYPRVWRIYGENVLQNWNGANGQELVNQWLNSRPHRLNLLNPAHTDLGVGVAVAPSGKLYATQNFVALSN